MSPPDVSDDLFEEYRKTVDLNPQQKALPFQTFDRRNTTKNSESGEKKFTFETV